MTEIGKSSGPPSRPAENNARLAENIVHFCRALRRAGLPVGPKQVLDAMAAVESTGLRRRGDFYWALHATLINRREAHEIFDQAFHIFWRDPKLLERLMATQPPKLPGPNTTQAQRRVVEALFGDGETRPEPEPEIDKEARESFSATEALRTKDFEQMGTAEQAQAKAAIARLRLPFDEIPTRRSHPAQRGRLVNLRASLRASLRSHGIIALKRKDIRRRRPPLVVLCDISGSMSAYARVFLHFLHAITNDRDRVHCFLFGTRLTDVTRQLRHKDIDEALARVAQTVEDWDGGTRIGETLRTFNRLWARRVLSQGATVLLITDGLDRDAGEGLEPEIARLHRSARRLIWLNPLLRYDKFEPKSLGIQAMLPHVDEFRPVHNLESLDTLIDALSAPGPRKIERRAA